MLSMVTTLTVVLSQSVRFVVHGTGFRCEEIQSNDRIGMTMPATIFGRGEDEQETLSQNRSISKFETYCGTFDLISRGIFLAQPITRYFSRMNDHDNEWFLLRRIMDVAFRFHSLHRRFHIKLVDSCRLVGRLSRQVDAIHDYLLLSLPPRPSTIPFPPVPVFRPFEFCESRKIELVAWRK